MSEDGGTYRFRDILYAEDGFFYRRHNSTGGYRLVSRKTKKVMYGW